MSPVQPRTGTLLELWVPTLSEEGLEQGKWLRIATEDEVVREAAAAAPPPPPASPAAGTDGESYALFRQRLHDSGLELREGALVERHRWWSPSLVLRPAEETPAPLISLLPSGSAMLTEAAAQSERVHSVERPDLGGWTGGMIWEGSAVLSRVLISQPRASWRSRRHRRRRRVVELGCGCGMVGLTAALLGGDVTMTDHVLFMARLNLDFNFPELRQEEGGERWDSDGAEEQDDIASLSAAVRQRVRLRPLSWGDTAAAAALEPPYDLLLGSDLMYYPRHHQRLADTLTMLSTIGSEVLWATRDGAPGLPPPAAAATATKPAGGSPTAGRPFFYTAMEEHGWIVTDITASASVAAAKRGSACDGTESGRGALSVVRMVRTRLAVAVQQPDNRSRCGGAGAAEAKL